MAILKHFSLLAALLLLVAAAPADPAKPGYLPAGLFPNAVQVWFYADDNGIRFEGGKPILPDTRQLLDAQEAAAVRDTLVYFDIKSAPPGEYPVATCMWMPYYVFQFEGKNGEDLGVLVLGKSPRDLAVYPEALVKSGMPLVARDDGINKVIAHHLRPQQVAAISGAHSC